MQPNGPPHGPFSVVLRKRALLSRPPDFIDLRGVDCGRKVRQTMSVGSIPLCPFGTHTAYVFVFFLPVCSVGYGVTLACCSFVMGTRVDDRRGLSIAFTIVSFPRKRQKRRMRAGPRCAQSRRSPTATLAQAREEQHAGHQ